MSEALKRAQKKHEMKREIKRASFNKETESELLEFANSVDFSCWVKGKIREELKK